VVPASSQPRIRDLSHEHALLQRGVRRIAGVDEAGRGAWAGPVAAAAVILPPIAYEDRRLLWGLTDSKQLSAAERRRWSDRVHATAVAARVAFVSSRLIDRIGIAAASRLAMLRALDALPVAPDHVIVDAFPLPADCRYAKAQDAIVRADATCLSVAAASVCAKVARDELMQRLCVQHPAYGFGRHKGYGTAAHREALDAKGPSPLHRASFRPVAECRRVAPAA
jgi:ribonuclease HII